MTNEFRNDLLKSLFEKGIVGVFAGLVLVLAQSYIDSRASRDQSRELWIQKRYDGMRELADAYGRLHSAGALALNPSATESQRSAYRAAITEFVTTVNGLVLVSPHYHNRLQPIVALHSHLANAAEIRNAQDEEKDKYRLFLNAIMEEFQLVALRMIDDPLNEIGGREYRFAELHPLSSYQLGPIYFRGEFEKWNDLQNNAREEK